VGEGDAHGSGDELIQEFPDLTDQNGQIFTPGKTHAVEKIEQGGKSLNTHLPRKKNS